MIGSNSTTYHNAEQHRSSKGAVLSAMGKIFGVIGLLGAILIVAQVVIKSHQSGFNQSANNAVGTNVFQSKPQSLKIQSLNIDAAVENLGLNSDGTLEVPAKPEEVGWYIGSPVPGAIGPAVMVGHLDSSEGQAVFYNLKELQIGDEFSVQRENGSVAIFRVDAKEVFSQDKFPTEKIYGPIDYAGIRLITCTGTYSRLKGQYSDNLVVFGRLVKIIPE